MEVDFCYYEHDDKALSQRHHDHNHFENGDDHGRPEKAQDFVEGGGYSRHIVRGRDILCVFPEQDLSFGGAMFNLIIIITIAFQMCKINGPVIR